jgi:hypothetical protein
MYAEPTVSRFEIEVAELRYALGLLPQDFTVSLGAHDLEISDVDGERVGRIEKDGTVVWN